MMENQKALTYPMLVSISKQEMEMIYEGKRDALPSVHVAGMFFTNFDCRRAFDRWEKLGKPNPENENAQDRVWEHKTRMEKYLETINEYTSRYGAYNPTKVKRKLKWWQKVVAKAFRI